MFVELVRGKNAKEIGFSNLLLLLSKELEFKKSVKKSPENSLEYAKVKFLVHSAL